MFAISNAFLFQAEIVQKDRWVGNPLEVAFVDFPPRVSLGDESLKLELGAAFMESDVCSLDMSAKAMPLMR